MKRRDQRLTCFELRAALRTCELTQRQLAALAGVSPNTVWRWCDGSLEVPLYVDTLLALFRLDDPWNVVDGVRPKWVVEAADVYRPKDTFKSLSMRWHPDHSRRDTNREMRFIMAFREAAGRRPASARR